MPNETNRPWKIISQTFCTINCHGRWEPVCDAETGLPVELDRETTQKMIKTFTKQRSMP